MAKQGLDAAPIVIDRERGWIERLPERLRPYAVLARWDRPIGSWLLLCPAGGRSRWRPAARTWWLVALFGIGAVAMRGAGCVVNDLIDRDLDARVARTRQPAAGERPARRAAGAGLPRAPARWSGCSSCSRSIRFAIALALASLPLIVIYPLDEADHLVAAGLPRHHLQLGRAGRLGGGDRRARARALLLYAAGFFWTLGYDTIYAHQDKADDALIGDQARARAASAPRRRAGSGASTASRSRCSRPPAGAPAWASGFYALLLAVAGALRLAGPRPSSSTIRPSCLRALSQQSRARPAGLPGDPRRQGRALMASRLPGPASGSDQPGLAARSLQRGLQEPHRPRAATARCASR